MKTRREPLFGGLPRPGKEGETEAVEVNNFDLIARFYDELLAWAPYELWIAILLDGLKEFGLPDGAAILDAACGSGLSTLPLARAGYRVTGIDHSAAMLDLAREKASEERLAIEFHRGDLLAIPWERRFGAVVCMHSGLDYILELDRLRKAFENVRKCLGTGGLFAFDKCLDEPDFYRTPQKDMRRLSNAEAVFEYDWDRKRHLFHQDCRISFTDDDGNEQHIRMLQSMRAVPLRKLLKMVEQAGFRTLRPPRQFTLTDPGMGIFQAV